MSDNSPERALSGFQRFAYSVGNFGVGLLPSIIGSWAMYYYAPTDRDDSCLITFVSIGLIGFMLGIGRVAEALINPFIGDWSDKTKSRWGRRMPYIIFGSPVMVIAMVMVWFPPVQGESLINAAWVCFWMCIMSMAFAAVVAPYLSLLPELTPHNDERISLSAYMAVGEVIGVLAAAGGAGFLISSYLCDTPLIWGITLNGFQMAAILFSVITLGALWTTGFGIKEKAYSAAKEVTLPFLQGVKEVMKNKAFRPYLALVTAFRIGVDMVVVVIPYFMTGVMGGQEEDAVYVQLLVMVGAMLFFPLVNWMAVKYGKKRLTVWGCIGFVIVLPQLMTLGMIPGLTPMVHGYILFALATFPVAVTFVIQRPMMADVIDYDEEITGFRREAMFNGMEGLFTRSASGLAWIACSMLFFLFGKSVENNLGIMLVGPVGGAFVFLGVILFRNYPFEK